MALMFESLTTRLTGVLDRLKRRGALTEDDVYEAMREIRVALLEADVALPVVKDLVARVRERAVGQEVIKSITPGQMVVKIVHDELVAVLGAETGELRLASPPSVIPIASGLPVFAETSINPLVPSVFTTRAGRVAPSLPVSSARVPQPLSAASLVRIVSGARTRPVARRFCGPASATAAGEDEDGGLPPALPNGSKVAATATTKGSIADAIFLS